MRPQIVEPQGVDGRVCGLRIVVAGFEDRDLLPCRQTWRRDVVPVCSSVGGQPDQAIIRSCPDAVAIERRRRYRVDYPALLRLGRRLAAKDAYGCGHCPGLAGEVRTDLLPTLSAVAGSPQSVRREVEEMRIERREHNRLGPYHAKVRLGYSHWHHVLPL